MDVLQAEHEPSYRSRGELNMSQDPNAENKPASEPSYGTPPPSDPYDTSSSSHPYSSPDFYEVPDAPPPDPFSGAPLTPDPYGAPPPVPGYAARQEYYYDVPSTPLPLGEAIRQLPSQYRRVLTRPSAQTFIAEMGKAAWNIIWVQLIVYAVISALLAWLNLLINPAVGNMSSNSVLSPATIRAISLASSIGLVLFIPLAFFLHQGITYLIARAFNGTGTFVRQGYTALLILVPLGIASSLLNLIPILGILITIAALIYQIVLSVFAIMAVHRLSGGKATTVVILPVIIVGMLFCVISFVLGVIIAAARYR
jgi:hypothetical protein